MPPTHFEDLWIADHADILGGGQLFAERLVRHVTATGAATRVRLVCPEASLLAERCRDLPVEIVDAHFPDMRPGAAVAMPGAVARLRRVLREAGPDTVIVGNTARVQAYATLASGTGRGRRFIDLMHERDSAERATARLVHRRFGTLVAVGSNAARAYAAALGRADVQKINNFLLPDALREMVAVRRPRETGAPPALAALGRLIPEKGVLELVDELAAAPDAWGELIVAGPRQDERYAAEVERRVAELGLSERIRLIGEVDGPQAVLPDVDALVVPSVGNEAQPTAIIEALALGRPAIVRADVASDDFDGLPVVAYRTSADLASVLASLPRDPAPADELLARFGPDQALDGLAASVRS